ncbi:MAG: hypothetical protein ACRC41_11750 [Sarcina sp.]
MKTSFSLKDKLKVLRELKRESFFRLMAYDELDGIDDRKVNDTIVSIKNKLKQVRIILMDSVVKVKADKLLYIKGNIDEINDDDSFRPMIFSNIDECEEDIYPSYTGNGEIVMDLSFNDFIFIELEDEEIVIKEDSFWACDGDVGVYYEGEDELLLNGSGIVIIELPVSEREVVRCGINNDKLNIFSDDVILIRGNIRKRNSRRFKSYIGSGEIWLAPTRKVYDKIKYIQEMSE